MFRSCFMKSYLHFLMEYNLKFIFRSCFLKCSLFFQSTLKSVYLDTVFLNCFLLMILFIFRSCFQKCSWFWDCSGYSSVYTSWPTRTIQRLAVQGRNLSLGEYRGGFNKRSCPYLVTGCFNRIATHFKVNILKPSVFRVFQ